MEKKTKGEEEMKINPIDLDGQDANRLLLSIIIPRPIALVSTIGENGVFNIAPYSGLSPMCPKPALIKFNVGTPRDGRKKDTLVNIEYSKDFVINIVNEDMTDAMNQSSAEYPSDVDEFKEVGLTPIQAEVVKSPLVGESPISMECQLVDILEYGNLPRITSVVIGEVVRVHIKENVCENGQIQISAIKAIGRLGGNNYCRTTDIFETERLFG
ncbi:flavin reductase family protein [Chloroflexota bacterium]